MFLERKQRILIQVYRRAAELSDPDYRAILTEASGCRSSMDHDWTQPAFDRTMALLETRLFARVHIFEVDNPIGKNRYIKQEFYWRRRIPRAGEINSRQLHKINELWQLLVPRLPPRERNPVYFAGLVAKATGRTDVGISRLSSSDAWHVIEALKDRLGYAIREKNEVPS